MSLALKYRPSNFKDLAGQIYASQSLRNALQFNQIAHAYLFYGSRGVGKTSTARILAKCLNCVNGPTDSPCEVCENCIEIKTGQSTDVIEMDAASNRGIEYIRELRENARFAAMKSKHKIYIIDEVHMLTNESFNALLKILEEPPAKVIFILATTEKHKIPETILSRCQCFVFKKFSFNDIKDRLTYILKNENINFEENALVPLAHKAEGSMRDAISLLDQAIAYCYPNDLTELAIKNVLGIIDFDIYCQFLEAMQNRDFKTILAVIDRLHTEGVNLKQFIWDLVECTKNAYLIKTNGIEENSDILSISEYKTLQAVATKWDLNQLQMTFEELYQLYSNFTIFQNSKSSEIRISIEMAIMKIFLKLNNPSVSTLIHKLSELKGAIEGSYTNENKNVKQQIQNPIKAQENIPKQNIEKLAINNIPPILKQQIKTNIPVNNLPKEQINPTKNKDDNTNIVKEKETILSPKNEIKIEHSLNNVQQEQSNIVKNKDNSNPIIEKEQSTAIPKENNQNNRAFDNVQKESTLSTKNVNKIDTELLIEKTFMSSEVKDNNKEITDLFS